MNFDFSEEQVMLRDMLSGYLANNHAVEQRRAILNSPDGFASAIWSDFATELGILGAPFPETMGGFGGSALENMIVMEELGKALALEPWNETIVMAGALLTHGGKQADEVLGRVIAGEAIIVPALPAPGAAPDLQYPLKVRKTGTGYVLSGALPFVRNAVRASHYVAAGVVSDTSGPTLFLISANTLGIGRTDYAMVDGSRYSDLTFEEVEVPATAVVGEIGGGANRIAEAWDQGNFALCAESLGIQRRLLEWTVEYSRQRNQFGRPIGTFQVLQHRMAEMYMKVEETASMAIMLCAHMADPPELRAKHVSAAKVLVDQSGQFVGEAAVQIHGGMGMTKELPIADYFSRLVAIAHQLGSTEYHFRRYEAASFNL